MKFDPLIEICGQGAVTPAGVGVEFLLDDKPCAFSLLPKLVSNNQKPENKESAVGHPVYSVNLNDPRLARWQKEPRLRRAPRIALFMIEAARQALDEAMLNSSSVERGAWNVEPSSIGIVAAYFTGSIVFTRRFFQESLQNKGLASPALFPETVFNSPTSHIASLLGVTGPCYSVVGDNSAWVSAVAVAHCWLKLGTVQNVLVLAAEELDPLVVEGYARGKWIRKKGGIVPSEGAGAILLRKTTGKGNPVLSEIAEGFAYRNSKEAKKAAFDCVSKFSHVQNVYRSAGNNWFGRIEEEIHGKNLFNSPPTLPDRGEAFTASAAWNTLRACAWWKQGWDPCLLPVWGLHTQCSALLFGGASSK